jgi:hypothetical protein
MSDECDKKSHATTGKTCETCECNVMGKYDDICDDCDATFKNWRPKPRPAAQDADELKPFEYLNCEVNRITAYHRHSQKVSRDMLDRLCNAQIDAENMERNRLTSRPMSAETQGIAGRYPKASAESKKLGWTLSTDFLQRVGHEAWHTEPDSGAYSDEEVEFILLKAEELLAKQLMSAEVEKAIAYVDSMLDFHGLTKTKENFDLIVSAIKEKV